MGERRPHCGVLLATALNALSPAYGSGLLAEILTAQALAAAIGVVVWRRQWIAKGWYPTYIPVVSVAPAAVLAYGGTATAIVGGALLGALLGPPLAAALSPSAQGFSSLCGQCAVNGVQYTADRAGVGAVAGERRALTAAHIVLSVGIHYVANDCECCINGRLFCGKNLEQLAQALRSRRTSAVELTEHALAGIAAIDPVLNAFAHVAAEQARRSAAEADSLLAAGKDLGILHGVPVGIKDNIMTAGMPTTMGSAHFRDFVPEHDAGCVAALKGRRHHTRQDDDARVCLWPDRRLRFAGATRNPWDRSKMTGVELRQRRCGGRRHRARRVGHGYRRFGADPRRVDRRGGV